MENINIIEEEEKLNQKIAEIKKIIEEKQKLFNEIIQKSLQMVNNGQNYLFNIRKKYTNKEYTSKYIEAYTQFVNTKIQEIQKTDNFDTIQTELMKIQKIIDDEKEKQIKEPFEKKKLEKLAADEKERLDIEAENKIQLVIDENEKQNFPLCFAVRDAVRKAVRCTEDDYSKKKNYLGNKCVEGEIKWNLKLCMDIVEKLITKDPRSINTPNEIGESPLFIAGLGGNLQLVQILINNGAVVTLKDIVKLAAFCDLVKWIQIWLDKLIEKKIISLSDKNLLIDNDDIQVVEEDEEDNFGAIITYYDVKFKKDFTTTLKFQKKYGADGDIYKVLEYLKIKFEEQADLEAEEKRQANIEAEKKRHADLEAEKKRQEYYPNIKDPKQSFWDFYFEPGFDGGKRKNKTRKNRKYKKNKKRFSCKN